MKLTPLQQKCQWVVVSTDTTLLTLKMLNVIFTDVRQ